MLGLFVTLLPLIIKCSFFVIYAKHCYLRCNQYIVDSTINSHEVDLLNCQLMMNDYGGDFDQGPVLLQMHTIL